MNRIPRALITRLCAYFKKHNGWGPLATVMAGKSDAHVVIDACAEAIRASDEEAEALARILLQMGPDRRAELPREVDRYLAIE